MLYRYVLGCVCDQSQSNTNILLVNNDLAVSSMVSGSNPIYVNKRLYPDMTSAIKKDVRSQLWV